VRESAAVRHEECQKTIEGLSVYLCSQIRNDDKYDLFGDTTQPSLSSSPAREGETSAKSR
jgi:hypothetical protein